MLNLVFELIELMLIFAALLIAFLGKDWHQFIATPVGGLITVLGFAVGLCNYRLRVLKRSHLRLHLKVAHLYEHFGLNQNFFLPAEVQVLLNQNKRTEAIKLYRQLYPATNLREAMNIIDAAKKQSPEN